MLYVIRPSRCFVAEGSNADARALTKSFCFLKFSLLILPDVSTTKARLACVEHLVTAKIKKDKKDWSVSSQIHNKIKTFAGLLPSQPKVCKVTTLVIISVANIPTRKKSAQESFPLGKGV